MHNSKFMGLLTAFTLLFNVDLYNNVYADSDNIMLGDVNCDSIITAVDASCILAEYAYESSGKTTILSNNQKKAADVNCDNVVDARDAAIILSYYAYVSVNDYISIEGYIADYRYSKIKPAEVDLYDIPSYTEKAFVELNDNIPQFNPLDFEDGSFEYYSELDSLGRCGVCMACIGKDIMPTEERGSIGMIKPTGWHLDKYDIVEGKYLYNRCHLIGFQLTGENANPKNLITGTRYLNNIGMLPFENQIASYIERTNHQVLYRVTPIFEDNDLLCKGVVMEGWSLQDDGAGICFNVFCYNVQPGIVIDYSNGDNYIAENVTTTETMTNYNITTTTHAIIEYDYVVNVKTKVFHLPDCPSVKAMNEGNKMLHKGEREQLIENGYSPCKRCLP